VDRDVPPARLNAEERREPGGELGRRLRHEEARPPEAQTPVTWQRTDVICSGLPCAAAFACMDYKVQSKTLAWVALELCGIWTTVVDGKVVPSQCDPYSLYVQLSRCPSLDGVMLLSKARERDIVDNTVLEVVTAAEKRLEQLSEATIGKRKPGTGKTYE